MLATTWLCKHDFCASLPVFNVKGSKTGLCCEHHAGGGMMGVCNRLCSYEPCTNLLSYNVEGMKTTTVFA